MLKNFTGLLKRRRGYHFLNSNDLIRFFIEEYYPDECVVAIIDCIKAFTSIPKLNILKRDDYSSYLLGLSNEFVIIEFADIQVAEDFVFSFPIELKIRYQVYNNKKLIRDEKGKIK